MKHKKTLTILLTLTCMLTGLFVFSSCNKENAQQSSSLSQMEQIYAQYVANTEAEGKTPLSYEAWLATIQSGNDNREDGNEQENSSSSNQHVCNYDAFSVITKKTCTTDGVTLHYCTECGEGKYVTEKAEGHSLISVSGKAVTCTSNGWTAYQKCKNDDCTYTEGYQLLTTKGHAWNSGELVAPNCTNGGYTLYGCTVCSETKMENPTQPIKTHDYVEGFCSVCKNVPFTYEISADGTYYSVTGLIDKGYTDVVIPATYKEKKVCALANSAFKDTDIKSIHIGANVTELGQETFMRCTNLTKVTFENPNNIAKIDNYLFSGCTSLSNVVLGDNVTFVGSYAFKDCNTSLFTQSDNVYYLGTRSNAYAFAMMPVTNSVTTINIHGACKSITDFAFYDCDYLRTVTFANGCLCATIGNMAFASCDSLQTVTFANNDACKTIGRGAFFSCTQLSNVTLPRGVQEIGDTTFSDCTNLTYIHLGESLKKLGSEALFNCGALEISIPDTIESMGLSALGVPTHSQHKTTTYTYTYKDDIGYLGNEQNPYVVAMYVPNLISDGGLYSPSKEVAVFEEGCKIIYDNASQNCNYLNVIVIPSSVTYVGKHAFTGRKTLGSGTIQTFYVDSERVMRFWHEDWVVEDEIEIVYNQTIMEEDFIYQIEDDETITLLSYIGVSTDIKVPAKIDGRTVATIGSNTFSNNNDLIAVVLQEGITRICENAFYNCSKLKEIHLPQSLRIVEIRAFNAPLAKFYYAGDIANWCLIQFQGRHHVEIDAGTAKPSGELYINNQQIKGCLVIPEGVTSIGQEAFYNCDELTSVIIPNSVTTIGYKAFADCDNLTSIRMGNALEIIGDDSLRDCRSLRSVMIPDSVKYIGCDAFANNSHLISVTIGRAVMTIGDRAFESCSHLTVIYNKSSIDIESNTHLYSLNHTRILTEEDKNWTFATEGSGFVVYTNGNDKVLVDYIGTETALILPNGITEIKRSAFYACRNLTNVTIGNSVTSIGAAAFYDCSNLTSVTIGNSVTSIGATAFYCCYRLTNLTIGNSVTSIGESAFTNCHSLTSVTIPDGVTSIDQFAFDNCDLTSVTIPNSVTTIGYGAFSSCDFLMRVYYKGTAEAWEQITIHSNNTALSSATWYYYSETKPTEAGNYWYYDQDGNIAVWEN